MPAPIITLTTDFGTADHYVAAMKGVILGLCGKATIVDISHEVEPYSIIDGAWAIAQSWRCFPKGTTHIVVVDPGVGTKRRPILAELEGHRFLAPDNGVLTLVMQSAGVRSRSRPAPHESTPAGSAQAGRIRIREITAETYFRQPVSQTFHGRDIFAPVAARLAGGLPASKVGPAIEKPIRLPFGQPLQTGPGTWTGMVLHIDRFGNVVTNFSTTEWPNLHNQPFSLLCQRKVVTGTARSYEAIKSRRLSLIAGSSGYWEISCNQQDASKILKAEQGSPLIFRLL